MPVVTSRSPKDLHFEPRLPAFDLQDGLSRDWLGGSPFRTAYLNAMSCMFPIGEKFFIDSVRHFRDQIDDPRLLQEIRSFQGQEATHRLQHQKFNEMLCAARGFDLDAIEAPLRNRLAWVQKKLSPRRQLAGTVAYEHLTAVMAHDLLVNNDVLQDADPRIAALWRWHAVEETEHKSVAFDVYMAVGGNTSERRVAMIMNTWYFLGDVFHIMRLMANANGERWKIGEWIKGLNYLFGKPGILRRCAPAYFRFYRDKFHPWHYDNRHVIDEWKRSTS